MTRGFRLTPRAVQDLREIGRYTQKAWGRTQRDLYLRELDDRFAWLADNPQRGRRRDDVGPGYICFRHEAHLIFYMTRDGGIDIIGVPHQAMDVVGRLRNGDVDD